MREGVRREEFAKMPSYGSLQQAVKVRPGRGEKERREGEKKPLWVYRIISASS